MYAKSVHLVMMARPNRSHKFCDPGTSQLDVAALLPPMLRLVLPEKWSQRGADWDYCPTKCMLDKQLHPTIGQVLAPDILKQGLNA